MPKVFSENQQLKEKIALGINKLADNVSSTLGPRGRNVILHQKGKNPIVTKDGVSVSRFIDFDDPFENLGAQLIKQAAEETNISAGDGTTTATVLAREIYNEAQKYIISGRPPIELKREIEAAAEKIFEYLSENSTPIANIQQIEDIAIISANGDSIIGKLIAKAVDAVGKDGSISIQEARSLETSLDLVEGFRIDAGYVSSQFITDERRSVMKYNNPYFLITNDKIDSIDQLMPALQIAAREKKPLILIADEVTGQALAALILNTLRGSMQVAAIKPPRYGLERQEILKDLAISTGAVFFDSMTDKKIETVKLEDLGRSKSIEATKNSSIIIGGFGDSVGVDQRINSLKEEIKEEDNLHVCQVLQERITRLASGVAIISVGAPTEAEMIEKKHRIEDALEAVRSAQQEGIICGGGIALLNASALLDLNTAGAKILKKACEAPFKQMLVNAEISADIIIRELQDQPKGFGYDVHADKIVDLLKSGIIDPVRVTRCALQNAVSAASTLITTGHAVVEI
jgi:chaperonin GroEL